MRALHTCMTWKSTVSNIPDHPLLLTTAIRISSPAEDRTRCNIGRSVAAIRRIVAAVRRIIARVVTSVSIPANPQSDPDRSIAVSVTMASIAMMAVAMMTVTVSRISVMTTDMTATYVTTTVMTTASPTVCYCRCGKEYGTREHRQTCQYFQL